MLVSKTDIYFAFRILSTAGIDLPRHAVLDRDLPPEEIHFEEQVNIKNLCRSA